MKINFLIFFAIITLFTNTSFAEEKDKEVSLETEKPKNHPLLQSFIKLLRLKQLPNMKFHQKKLLSNLLKHILITRLNHHQLPPIRQIMMLSLQNTKKVKKSFKGQF